MYGFDLKFPEVYQLQQTPEEGRKMLWLKCFDYNHNQDGNSSLSTSVYDNDISPSQNSPNKCTRYDTKQSDGEVPIMLELWGMLSGPSLALLPGSLWLRVEAPDRVLYMGQIELFEN